MLDGGVKARHAVASAARGTFGAPSSVYFGTPAWWSRARFHPKIEGVVRICTAHPAYRLANSLIAISMNVELGSREDS